MSNSFASHNSKVFKAGLEQYKVRVMKQQLLTVLKSVAQTMVSIIDGSFTMPDGSVTFPVWSANLHDATGVGVYSDGAIQYFMPTKKATSPQRIGLDNNIWGASYLQMAISNGSSKFSKGIWLVLFSSIPYAYEINAYGSPKGRGASYFEALKNMLLEDVMANLKPIK